MRNERPQKGRLREFFQLNADIFGVKSVPIDVELVQLAIYIMKLFGASEKMFEIRINNREFFTYYISNVIGITENIQEVSRVIDNFAKYTESENIQKLKVLNLTDTQINQVLRISNLTIDSVREYVEKCTGAKDLVSLLDQLGQLGLGKYIRFEPMLVRGFDYYTGNVFEQFDLAPGNNRSMFGGGRYDKLVGIYSGIDTPANGFAPGTVTTSIFLDTWNLWPKWDNTTKVLVTVFNPNLLYKSIEIASQLRDGGVTTELYLGEKASISDQLGYASKKEISYVVICGPEESEKKQIVLKNLQTGRQETLAINSVIDMLKE
jgi:histidyl-tRNA synthetase